MDSPTAERLSTRLYHAINIERGWTEAEGDVPNAFLQGHKEELKRIIWVEPTPELNLGPEFTLRVLVPEYGSNDAPVGWYRSLRRWMVKNKCFPLRHDPCIFCHYNQTGVLDGHFCFHVDDFSTAGTPQSKNTVGEQFCSRYSVPEVKYGQSETKLCGVWTKQEVKGGVLEKIQMHPKRGPGAALILRS